MDANPCRSAVVAVVTKTAVAAGPAPRKPLRVIALEQQIRDLGDLVGLATDELRDLVHSGWSAHNERRALELAESIDRRAVSLR